MIIEDRMERDSEKVRVNRIARIPVAILFQGKKNPPIIGPMNARNLKNQNLHNRIKMFMLSPNFIDQLTKL